MPRDTYQRWELEATLRQADDSRAGTLVELGAVRVIDASQQVFDVIEMQGVVSTARLEEIETPGAPVNSLLPDEVRRFVENYCRTKLPEDLESPSGPRSHLVRRVVLRCRDDAIHEHDWEAGLPREPSSPIVRVIPVIARSSDVPFTLPLRIAQINPSEFWRIRAIVTQILGGADLPRQSFDVAETDVDSLSRELRSWEWPTAEVLHFDHWPDLDRPERALSTISADSTGTLAWLARMTDMWQTRLVVLHCRNVGEARTARRLAAALLGRGGPAVIVLRAEEQTASSFYEHFYERLVHDRPLDVAAAEAAAIISGHSFEMAMFTGPGRDEAMRVSNPGAKLAELAPSRPRLLSTEGDKHDIDYDIEGDFAPKILEADADTRSLVEGLDASLSDFADNRWGKYEFWQHESDGAIPLGNDLHGLKQKFIAWRSKTPAQIKTKRPSGPRFVNSGFWEPDLGWAPQRVLPSGPPLVAGRSYCLGIQIGARDRFAKTIGATALLEELFQWRDESDGQWLEVGVTGIDFDVIGDPVQELWLPRIGPSRRLYFTVVPRLADVKDTADMAFAGGDARNADITRAGGVTRLRFCVYFRGNLIQSFRVAAWTVDSDEQALAFDTSDRVRQLALALDVPERRVEESGARSYLARLEYSLPDQLDDLERCPERDVSIVANNWDGLSVVTTKSVGRFGVRTNVELPKTIKAAWEALKSVSTTKDGGYAFLASGQRNHGTTEGYSQALIKLADAGSALFSAITSKSERRSLLDTLESSSARIHVAHVLLDKTIPWAVTYSRDFDPRSQDMPPQACMAPFVETAGQVEPCGSHADCPLHPNHQARRQAAQQRPLEPKNVACPRHFWGFRHLIEIPPCQGESATETATAVDATQPSPGAILSNPGAIQPEPRLPATIRTTGKARVACGFNTDTLPLANTHQTNIQAVVQSLGAGVELAGMKSSRDDVLSLVDDPSLAVIYFYCHAGGTLADSPELAFLEFSRKGRIQCADLSRLESDWSLRPLVILNGCGTVGGDPRSLSPFIRTLVDDCHASGVVGTEVALWEALAGEFAEQFLTRFLAEKPAGESLRETRHALLAKRNPLGLVFTLYAALELQIHHEPAHEE